MSVPDYRTWVETRPDDERWELLDGEPVLMSPPRERHQTIVARLIRCLGDLADPAAAVPYPPSPSSAT